MTTAIAAAGRPQRRRRPARRSRLLTLVTCLALLPVWYGLTQLAPFPTDLLHPFGVTGEVRQTIDAGDFTVKVAPPKLVAELSYRTSFGDPEPLTSSGIWVVIPVELIATSEPMTVRGVELRTASGRRYAVSGRLPTEFRPGASPFEPGIAMIGGWIFEVQRDDLAGAELYVSRDISAQLSRQVRIDLELEAGAGDKVEESFTTVPTVPRMER